MKPTQANCSVCASGFSPQFSYQVEERPVRDADGTRVPRTQYFCSRKCLEHSLMGTAPDSGCACGACGRQFQVELASQVLFLGGQRRYACSPPCRAQLIGTHRHVSLTERIAAEATARARREDSAAPAPESHSLPAPQAPNSLPSQDGALELHAAPAIQSSSANEVVSLPNASQRRPIPVAWRRVEAELSGGPKTLAVFNHKGGTGKTTTAVTVAYGLAARGHSVLLVDTDGQGNVAVSLGLKPKRTLYHVLVLGQPFNHAVVEARPHLDVLPSDETLAAAELYLAGRAQRDQVLATRLAAAKDAYDYIVVDCSPSLSLMSQNALVFADAVLCPVACDYLSLVGVRQVLRTIKQVNRHLNHPVRLWGVLPTMYDARALVCREALDTLRQHFGTRCLEPVRNTIKVKEAPAHGQTILEYAPGSNAASDYEQVVARLVEVESDQKLQRTGGAA